MNHELIQLVRETGFLSDADLSPEQRYNLLTLSFWRRVDTLGYNVPDLKRILWIAAGRKEDGLRAILPDAPIQKAVRSASKEPDPRKRIKETAAAIVLLYKKGEKDIRAAIDANLEQPERMRAETGRIRRELLMKAASWLAVSVPGLYVAGAKVSTLQGPHARAAQAMAAQEMNRFREIDSTIGRHVEEVIAESEKRRTQHALMQSQAMVDYSGLRGRVVGHKTIDGKLLSLADYASMLAITAARNFYNEAVQNRLLEDGSDLAMISREVRANSCGPCREWAGKTISISGKTPGYPTQADAEAAGIWHPHCIHILIPLNYQGST